MFFLFLVNINLSSHVWLMANILSMQICKTKLKFLWLVEEPGLELGFLG
jgi:hypothetical protein